MHDHLRTADTTLLLRRAFAEIDALKCELQQLRRRRDARQINNRHDPVFCVFNEPLLHKGTAEVERLISNPDTSDGAELWIRSGETFTVTDIWLNTDDFVDTKTLCTVIPYEGREVPESIYCKPSNWLADPEDPEEE